MFLQWISIERGARAKNQGRTQARRRKPGLVVQVLEAPLTGKSQLGASRSPKQDAED
jgi:hypothetical protein